MSPARTRAVRLSALALATGTVVATAATGATAAASSSTPTSYAGNTGSSEVSLALTLPGASTLAGQLGNLPVASPIGSDGAISASLLEQTGSLQHDGTGKTADVATSTSTLVGGTLGATLTSLQQQSQGSLVLNQTVTSSLKHPGTVTSSPALAQITDNLPAQIKALLDLNVPGLSVTTAASPLATSGKSVVAGVDLGKIADAFPAGSLDALTAALNAAVTQLQGATTTASGSLGSALTTLTGQLGGILGGTPLAGLGTTITNDSTDLQTLLTELSNELPGVISNIEDGSIVSLNGLSTTHDVKTVGAQQISTVSNKLASLSILGGLFTVDGFANSLTTQAGGTAGTAKVIAQPNLAKVTAGTNNELSVVLGSISSVSGSVAQLYADTAAGVPGLSSTQIATLTSLLQPVTDGLTTLTDALNSALGAAGVSIKQDAVTQNDVAKDGTSAKAALSGLQIVIDPLSKLPIPALAKKGNAAAAATPPLLAISVGALDADSAASVVSPAVAGESDATTGVLAFTGADLPLTAGIATLLIAGSVGLVIRRRRTTEEI